MAQTAEAIISAKVAEVLAKAKVLFPVCGDLKISDILFYSKGTAAGYAGHETLHGIRKYFLKFSTEAYDIAPETILNDTVPHEVAHLVAFAMAGATYNRIPAHGKVWKSICIRLGGTGERTHSITLTSARRRVRYIYTLNSGRVLSLTKAFHVKLTNGQAFHTRNNQEAIAACHYTKMIVL